MAARGAEVVATADAGIGVYAKAAVVVVVVVVRPEGLAAAKWVWARRWRIEERLTLTILDGGFDAGNGIAGTSLVV
jgi:hypothetical protein